MDLLYVEERDRDRLPFTMPHMAELNSVVSVEAVSYTVTVVTVVDAVGKVHLPGLSDCTS